MKRLTLSTTDALDFLAKAVAEKGVDYVYPEEEFGGCMNAVLDEQTQEWHPACIVGYAMNQAGYTADDIATYDLAETGVGELIDSGALDFEEDAGANAWSIAQMMQDSGFTWGQSLDAAQRVANGENPNDVYREYEEGEVAQEQLILF